MDGVYGDGVYGIGALARETGTKVPTIRYYEQIGLMPEPVRSEGNQRRYGPAHLDRLNFIRHGRELGFTLEAIRNLLDCADDPGRPCGEVDEIARENLAEVERRLTSLRALRKELKRMIGQCEGGTVDSCRVIEVLSDHAKCGADSHL